jgi:fructokinase
MADTILGAIEAGGTKVNCAIGTGEGVILDEIRIETTTPDETIAAILDFFRRAADLSAIGIASFGPVQLDRSQPLWGHILKTPKPGWSHVDLAGRISAGLELPVAFETDVNGAVIGESRLGVGRGLDNLAYVTIGTGIGAGIISGGRLVQGLSHPEIGHVRPRRHEGDRDFAGSCPFHGDCVEGLASGPAILKRCGAPLNEMPQGHPIWEVVADYLAQLCAVLILTVSPQRIVLGGGVMMAPGLLKRIRASLIRQLCDYPAGISALLAGDFLSPPGLAGRSALIGSLFLAHALLRDETV